METKKSKTLNITLWIVQSILAAFFLMSGIVKFSTSIEEQRATMEWPKHVSAGVIHFVGILEIIGALGLLLPSILRIQPKLTPWAATGLALVMVMATALNLSIGETKAIGLLIVVALAFFVAWGRFKKSPILPK
ncbi:MAG: DoxX family protein [Bacteroidia bacterium]